MSFGTKLDMFRPWTEQAKQGGGAVAAAAGSETPLDLSCSSSLSRQWEYTAHQGSTGQDKSRFASALQTWYEDEAYVDVETVDGCAADGFNGRQHHFFPSSSSAKKDKTQEMLLYQRMHNLSFELYKCDVRECDKVCVSGHGLTIHKALCHPSQTWFGCDECEKFFYKKHNLKKHKKTVHTFPKIAFQCDACNHAYSTSRSYRMHLSTQKHKVLCKLKAYYESKQINAL